MSVHPLTDHKPEARSSATPVLLLDERLHSRLGLWLVLAGFGGFLLWAALAPLDKGVAVSGNIMVSGNRQAVQHASGGIIEGLYVRDGDHVQAGQVLLRLDGTRAQAEYSSLHAQYVSTLATEARLTAELDGLQEIDFPAPFGSVDQELALDPLKTLQGQLLRNRQQAQSMEQSAIRENIAGSQAMLLSLRETLRHKQEQQQSLAEQLLGLRNLARDGYIPRNRLLETERLHAQLSGDISQNVGNIANLQRQISELRLNANQREQEYQRDVREQLAEVQWRSNDLASRLKQAEFELDHLQVRAPASGTVVGLSVFTESGVISPGQSLMEIVPTAAPLLVEVQAPVEMVDKLYVGLPVELMFVAFNQNRTPRVAGEISLVSADRLMDERSGLPYYQMQIRVSAEGIAQLAGQDIRPGMPVNAFVRTGERSLLNYLFKPLLDRTHMAMVEE